MLLQVEDVYNTVHRVRNNCVFTLSPFGLYRPGEEVI